MKIVLAIVGLLVVVLCLYAFFSWSKSVPAAMPMTEEVVEEMGEEKIVAVPPELLDPVSDFAPSEVFRGTDSAGGEIIFRQQDYNRYELTLDKLERRGDLNIERGWQDDVDATVYVLNWQRPVEEQMVFVRTTAEPRMLIQLDASRNPVMPQVILSLSE